MIGLTLNRKERVALLGRKMLELLQRSKVRVQTQFAIPATYPTAAPELAVPELEGKQQNVSRRENLLGYTF